jgi:hypothetical protein
MALNLEIDQNFIAAAVPKSKTHKLTSPPESIGQS